MHLRRKLFLATLMTVLVLAARVALAAPADEKEKVLRRLDAVAANFHSTTADFEFDSVETDPIPDKDVQKGTVYYERKSKSFQMAAHIREENSKPIPKVYIYSDGSFRLYEKKINQVTTLSKLSQYESWFMLGFGASGKDLEEKWDISYKGTEMLDGVMTSILEMVPKDLAIRKNLPKVTVWIDLKNGVNLKQVFEEGPGQYRVCVYFKIKVNEPLPKDAFNLGTDNQTQYVKR